MPSRVDDCGDPGPERGRRSAGAIEGGVNEVGAGCEEGPHAVSPVLAQLLQGAGAAASQGGSNELVRDCGGGVRAWEA